MMPSATASSPTNANINLAVVNNIPSNLPVINTIENNSGTQSVDNGSKFQSSSQVKPQVLPVVYIQTPAKLPFVSLNKSSNTNVIVKSAVPSLHFSNLPPTISTKPIASLTSPSSSSNQNVLLPNNSKPQQILIQKSGGITNAYLTMLKPSIGIYNEHQQANHITANTTSYVQSNVTQKFVIAPLPKTGANLAQTVTTNSSQSKLAFMPLQIKTTTTEPTMNNYKVFNPVLNFKIADGKVQSASNNSPLTVMCDSNSIGSSSENSNENKLICTEVIDLDSPEKEYKSDESQNSTELSIDTSVDTTNDMKFSQHGGVSILKKNITLVKDLFSTNTNSVLKNNEKETTELTIEKEDVALKTEEQSESWLSTTKSKNHVSRRKTPNFSTIHTEDGITTIKPEEPPKTESTSKPKVQVSRRRKSNFSLRKDFDEVAFEFFEKKIDIANKKEINDVTIRKTDFNNEPVTIKIENDEKLDIKIIKETVDETDFDRNVNNNTDLCKSLKWNNNVGTLPGSHVKFIINEFNMLEYLTLTEYNKLVEDKFNTKPKEKNRDNFQEEIRCVECGCFGLPSDFTSLKYCSYDCQMSGKNKMNKEKENRFKKRRKVFTKKRTVEVEEKPKIVEESETSDDNSSNNSKDKFSYPWYCPKKGFSWAKYLEHMKAKAAPVKLFKEAFPYNRNGFKPGMKLEGVDPLHPSYFCVLTVVETQGYRIRLHFDGFSSNYDFWVNADSMDIFPMGWCEKYGHVLRPPPGCNQDDFNWLQYLKETKSTAAPKHLFANRAGNAICPNGFRVGMKLEAVDKKNNSSLICVATVRDMMDNRILVHFDSWNDIYDYWAEPTSPYIHPVGWCDQYGHRLTPPSDYPRPKEFTWESYLRETKSVAAPVRAFKQKPVCGFKRGMKLETVDKRVPHLIRVASVDDVKEHQIKIHFDGWLDKYSYWVDDDNTDIHPAGWCQKTGHPIEPPLTPEDIYDFVKCQTIGCKGQGHILGAESPTHSSVKDCPYSDDNISRERKLPDRLLSPDRFVESVVPVSREPKEKPMKTKVSRSTTKTPRPELKEEEEEDEYEENKPKKFKKDHSDPCLDIEQDVEKRIMGYLQDIQISPVEKETWYKHSKFLNNYTEFKTDPRKWSSKEVASFIESLPTGSDYGSVFKSHEIDGEALLLLTQKDIMDILKIKLGPAIKLYNSIVLLRQNIDRMEN